MLMRFHLRFQNLLVVNNKWLQVALNGLVTTVASSLVSLCELVKYLNSVVHYYGSNAFSYLSCLLSTPFMECCGMLKFDTFV